MRCIVGDQVRSRERIAEDLRDAVVMHRMFGHHDPLQMPVETVLRLHRSGGDLLVACQTAPDARPAHQGAGEEARGSMVCQGRNRVGLPPHRPAQRVLTASLWLWARCALRPQRAVPGGLDSDSMLGQ